MCCSSEMLDSVEGFFPKEQITLCPHSTFQHSQLNIKWFITFYHVYTLEFLKQGELTWELIM